MKLDSLPHFVIPSFGRRDESQPRPRGTQPSQRLFAFPAAAPASNQDHEGSLLFFLRSIQMKQGPPTKAVMTPTGISTGASTVLERTSDRARKEAPIRNEVGIRIRWSAPTQTRIACGTMRPTKPIGPVRALPVPVSTEPLTQPNRRSLLVETPRVVAQSSPSARTFHSLLRQKTNRQTGRSTPVSPTRLEYDGASRPPIIQRVMAKDCINPARFDKNRTTAAQILFTVIPASSKPSEDMRPPSDAIRTTIPSTIAAPAKAARQTAETPPKAFYPKQMARTAPTEAPPDTPNVYG